MKKILALIMSSLLIVAALGGCTGQGSGNSGNNSGSKPSDSSGSGQQDPPPVEEIKDPIYNGVDESEKSFEAPVLNDIELTQNLVKEDNGYSLVNGSYKLVFEKTEESYSVKLVSTKDDTVRFYNETPARIYVTTNRKLTQKDELAAGYSELKGNKCGGITGVVTLNSKSGSEFECYDEYYVYNDLFNMRRTVRCVTASESAGYSTNVSFETKQAVSDYTGGEYFIPATIYNNSPNFLTAGYSSLGYAVSDAKSPMPMALMRIKSSGDVISISRKNPYVNTLSTDSGGYNKGVGYKYGSVGFYKGESLGIRLDYPCQEEGINTLTHNYNDIEVGNDIRFDITIYVNNGDYFSSMTEAYMKQLAVQNIKKANVDLGKMFKYSVEDLNSMAYNKNGVTLLPFARYVETGDGFNYYSESGFIGMQISLGYEMYRYGLAYDNKTSYDLGLSIVNMWANTAPYPGTDSGIFRCYRNESGYDNTSPTLRALTDGVEGMLDALRLAESADKSVDVSKWKDMVMKYADFLVSHQNPDGSWFRAYDYDGNKVVAGNKFNIPVNSNTIADSKLNTQIPIRFLVRMYEYTGDSKYLETAKKAGEYVINEIIPQGQFSGGTLDTQGVVDKESGIFCEYAMNALYAATGEKKWLTAATQSAVYAFSWTYTFDFTVYNPNNYAAGIPTNKGYTTGMSVISTAGYGADSFNAYLYYDLFKLHVWTGDPAFLTMADICQNHTKRIMDIDGEFGYKYRSFMIEATNISLFRFITAEETGVWLPWITNANIEPMTNMIQTFGTFDIAEAMNNYSSEQLAGMIAEYGAGGHAYGEIKK